MDAVSRYDEMERGTAEGVAIRSDGRLEAGPAISLLYSTRGNYVWSVAADAAGNAYVGMGGTAAGGAVVMRVAPDGKATKVFEGKELAVQALRMGADGAVYAATSPDGKVYGWARGQPEMRLRDGGLRSGDDRGEAEVSVGRWRWARTERLVCGCGRAGGGVPRAGRWRQGARLLFKTVDQHIRCLLMAPDGTLWAGSDGGRRDLQDSTTKAPGAKPFAAYAAPQAGDHRAGDGRRRATCMRQEWGEAAAGGGTGRLPPLPVTGRR